MRINFFVLFLLLNTISLFSLSNTNYVSQYKLIGDNMMVSVSETDGKFLLFYRENKEAKWIPLMHEDYPSTSYIRFINNGKTAFVVGESGRKNTALCRLEGDSILYDWFNDLFHIQLKYSLLSLHDSKTAESLIIDMEVSYLKKEEKTNYDFLCCFDTYLGEESKNHFVIPGNIVINDERELSDLEMIDWINTTDVKRNIGLSILFNNENQKKPDRIFFANWKSVEQSFNEYKIKEARSFDLKPYSINDSSCFVVYKNQEIYDLKPMDYRFILSLNNKKIEIAPKVETVQKEEKQEIKVEEKSVKPDNTVKEIIPEVKQEKPAIVAEKKVEKPKKISDYSLPDLLQLLDQINRKLKNNDIITEDELSLYKMILAEISKRSN